MDAIVFGIGSYFEIKREDIQKKFNIIAYLDNSVNPNETKVFSDGNKILNPKQVDVLPIAPILLMSARFMEMYEQLIKVGVDSGRILFGTCFKPAYDPFEKLLEECNGEIVISKEILAVKTCDEVYTFHTAEELKVVTREMYKIYKPEIDMISRLPAHPISRRYGVEHGMPIDRYYIERFLDDHKDRIKGDVAEFAEDTYTKRFGSSISNSYILHVNGWGENVLKADLVTGDGVVENKFDCLICTQVIQFIYEIDKAISNMKRMLKQGGYALVTAHGISQLSIYDYRNWGEYWRFTEMSMKRLLVKHFGEQNVEVISYGNVKIATALMYGLAVEDISESDFYISDEQYPVILGAVIRKA